jgi:hypothetical protein
MRPCSALSSSAVGEGERGMTISDYSASVGSLASLEYLEGVLLTPRSVQKVLEEEWMSVHRNELAIRGAC